MTDAEHPVIRKLIAARDAFLAGDQEGYTHALTKARIDIDRQPQPDSTLLGEWELTARLAYALDLDAGLGCLRRAFTLLQGKRSVVSDGVPLCLSSDSVFSCVYRLTDADTSLSKLREAVGLYNAMTGFGLGTDTLYDAELAYYRCDMIQASVLAHQAVYTARNTGQTVLAVGSAKLLAQIAKHRCDADAWSYAIHVLNASAKEAGENKQILNAINIIRYELSIVLGDFDMLPDWMRDGVLPVTEGVGILGLGYRLRNELVPAISLPEAIWTHMLYLLITGQTDRALAVDSLQHAMNIDTTIPILSLYFSQARAICLLKNGDRSAAKAILTPLVEQVLQDHALMLIAELATMTSGIVKELVGERDPNALRQLTSTMRETSDNPRKILEDVSGVHAIGSLTKREREIAILAAQGMSNAEIAENLHVTLHTVKFHLGNVFQKLSVNSRSRMASVLRNG